MKVRALLIAVVMATTALTVVGQPATAASVPSPPRQVRAAGADRAVRLTWRRPASNGGAPITDYVIRRRAAGSSRWITVADGVSPAREAIVTGLQNGRRYEFRVRAKNRAGAGRVSATVAATPATVPSGPRDLRFVVGDRSVRLTWQPPEANGGAPITDYEVRRRPTGSASWVTVPDGVSTTPSATVTGLDNGQQYEFTIRAKNRVGFGPSSFVWATPVTVPSAPRSLSAVAASRSVRLTWAAPASTGGAAVLAYRVQYRENGTTAWRDVHEYITGLTQTVILLTNGQAYQFRVAAQNGIGWSAFSTVVSATPYGAPDAPTYVQVGVDGTTATITFPTPNDGGRPIAGYDARCTSDNGGTTRDVAGSASPLVAAGLTSAKTYQCRVTAHNEIGTSPARLSLPFPVEAGLFAFLNPLSDGTYSRWNPCLATIDYQVDTRVGTAAELAQIESAVAEVETRTGHDFHYAGESPDGQYAPGVEMMLGYSTSLGPGGVIGRGGISFYGEEVVSGFALVLAGMSVDQTHSTWLHELGHAVGLGHVDDTAQIMYPVNLGLDDYGDGDREGLRLVGATMPCIATAADAHGRPQTITWIDEQE